MKFSEIKGRAHHIGRPEMDSTELQKTRLSSGLSVLLRFALSAVFITSFLAVTRIWIAPDFYYLGFSLRSPSVAELVTGAFVTGLMVVLCPPTPRRVSDVAFSFLVVTVGFPLVWVPFVFGQLDSSALVYLQLVVGLTFSVFRITLLLELRKVGLPKLSPGLYFFSLVAIAGSCFGLLLGYYGLRPEFLALDDVYDVRDEYGSQVGVLGSYVMGNLINAVLGVLLSFSLLHRYWSGVFFSGAGFLLAYSISGFKSFIVGLLLVLGAVVVVRLFRSPLVGWVSMLLIVTWVAVILDRFVGGITWTSVVVRRGLSTAGLNTSYYFEFFSEHPFYLLRHSIFGVFDESPYPLPPARIIGEAYYGSTDTAANANFVADGFANAGILGCAVAAIILGVFLRLVDSLSSELPVWFTSASITMFLVAISNTSLLTAFLTHGGALVLLLIGFSPVLKRVTHERTRGS